MVGALGATTGGVTTGVSGVTGVLGMPAPENPTAKDAGRFAASIDPPVE
ncbi:hypothetical protein Mlaev_01245 [Microbacterium laevaniformans]|uniref:Uncharacterized protein n=1 Tax=Microbacterium laevaniformans TaxID=36807 RepID=A0A150HGV2_9MICO|nr:hypothetical protein Mlaev_01245 [Microbacterium laevaniformans]